MFNNTQKVNWYYTLPISSDKLQNYSVFSMTLSNMVCVYFLHIDRKGQMCLKLSQFEFPPTKLLNLPPCDSQILTTHYAQGVYKPHYLNRLLTSLRISLSLSHLILEIAS